MRNSIQLVLIALLTVVSFGCSETKEIVIDREATKSGTIAATETKNLTPYQPDSVTSLKIGEIGRYSMPDPLVISSNSMLRTASLIYEGLTELNANNEIVPAIARSWEVNADSTQFTFHIDRTRTYHDSDAFLNGMGRPVSSKDVLFAFRRMTQPGVFPAAFNMFQIIKGFDAAYYQSHLPDYPNPSVSGIQAPNDSTVHIQLHHPDKDFLRKLAHPFASIYATESFDSGKKKFTSPIGTDEFMFTDVISDSVLVLQRARQSQPGEQFKQLHIYYSTNERSLYKFFAKQRLHLLPEIGPATAEELLQTDQSQLKSTYSNLYKLYSSTEKRSWEINLPQNIISASKTRLALQLLEEYSVNSAYYSLSLSDYSFTFPDEMPDSSTSSFYIHSPSLNRINYLLIKSGIVNKSSQAFKITNQSYICNGVKLSLSEKGVYLFGSEKLRSVGVLQTPVVTLTHKSGKTPSIETNAHSWWISITQSSR